MARQTMATALLCASLLSLASSAASGPLVLSDAPADAVPTPPAVVTDQGPRNPESMLKKVKGGAVGGALWAPRNVTKADGDAMSMDDTFKLPEQWRESCVLIALLVLISVANFVFCCPAWCCKRRQATQGQSVGLADAREVALEAAAPPPAPERIDTKALTGLRGLAALHVACGHYLSTSNLEYDCIGGASMSFFYLLSGFVMTLGYARTLTSADAAPKEAFNTKRFLKNRFARLVPTYLLTNAMNVALQVGMVAGGFGIGSAVPLIHGTAMTLVGANMWLFPLNAWIPSPEAQVQLPANVVTWTVQTMAFFYFCFPSILLWLRSVKRRALAMQLLFWWQGFTFMAVLLIGMYWVGNGNWAYWSARAWPLSRLPVFVMGCLAAVERMHGDGALSCFCCNPRRCCAGGDSVGWGRRASLSLGFYVALLVVSSAAFKVAESMNVKLLIRCGCEAFVPLLFINLIIALTRCGENGWAAKLCRSRALQFMGDIAMAFYMSHLTILMCFMVALSGKPQIAGSLWVCAVSMVLSLLFGWFVTKRFEQPIQRWLRG